MSRSPTCPRQSTDLPQALARIIERLRAGLLTCATTSVYRNVMNLLIGLFAGVPSRFFLLSLLTACVLAGVSRSATSAEPAGYTLYFSDEFEMTDTGGPNPSHWDYDVGYVRNKELQCYTDDRRENVRVEKRTFAGETSGYLVLELRKEEWACPQDNNRTYQYTSGAITSRKRKNGDYLIGGDRKSGLPFGIYEIRAKIPSGRGTWPALWLVGHAASPNFLGWPGAGEIDIMEAVGFEEANGLYRFHSTLHRSRNYLWPNGRGKSGQGMILNLGERPSEDFHIWTMIWKPNSIQIYVDDVLVTNMDVKQPDDSITIEQRNGFQRYDPGMNGSDSLAWPFARELPGNEFKLLLNLAWGGGWGGQKGIDDSILDDGPVEMLIDYVRIYTENQPQAPSIPTNLRMK